MKGYWVSVIENVVIGDTIVFLSLNDQGQMLTCSTGSVGTGIGQEYKLIEFKSGYAAISPSGYISPVKSEVDKIEFRGWLAFEKTNQVT